MCTKARHILLVKKPLNLLQTLTRLLEYRGYTVTQATTETQGEYLLTEGWFHLAGIEKDLFSDGPNDNSGYRLAANAPRALPKLILYDYFDPFAAIALVNDNWMRNFNVVGLKSLVDLDDDFLDYIDRLFAQLEIGWDLDIEQDHLNLDNLVNRLGGVPRNLPDGVSRELLLRCRREELDDLLRKAFSQWKSIRFLSEPRWASGRRLGFLVEAVDADGKMDLFSLILAATDQARTEHHRVHHWHLATAFNDWRLEYRSLYETSHYGANLYYIHRIRPNIHLTHLKSRAESGDLSHLEAWFKALRSRVFQTFPYEEYRRREGLKLDELRTLLPDRAEFEDNAVRLCAHLGGLLSIHGHQLIRDLDGLKFEVFNGQKLKMKLADPLPAAQRMWDALEQALMTCTPGPLSIETIFSDAEGQILLTDLGEGGYAPAAAVPAEIEALARYDLLSVGSLEDLARVENFLAIEKDAPGLLGKFPENEKDVGQVLCSLPLAYRPALLEIYRTRRWAQGSVSPNEYTLALYFHAARRFLNMDPQHVTQAHVHEQVRYTHLLLSMAMITETHGLIPAAPTQTDTIERRDDYYQFSGKIFNFSEREKRGFDILFNKIGSLVKYKDFETVLYYEDADDTVITRRTRRAYTFTLIGRIRDEIGTVTGIEGERWIETVRGLGYILHAAPMPDGKVLRK